ncbi:MAG: ComEA family DNA-binding protein [Gammaproteobacteria bacterium]
MFKTLIKTAVLVGLLAASMCAFAVQIDINSANAEKLALVMKNVGKVKAAAIVKYREENGPFVSIDELINVNGIGARTLEINRHLLMINEQEDE